MRDYVHAILDFTVGNIFGKDVTCREPIHRCDAYQPGVLVEFGRTGVKVCLQKKKIVIFTENRRFLMCGTYFL